MFTKSCWKLGIAVAAVLSLTGGTCVAQTNCGPSNARAGGFYSAPDVGYRAAITVANLTNSSLTPLLRGETLPKAVVGIDTNYPFQNFTWPIEPFRSASWASANHDFLDAPRFDGVWTFALKDPVSGGTSTFDVDFTNVDHYGNVYWGSWVYLSSSDFSSGSNSSKWCAPGPENTSPDASCGGIYRTEWMHRYGDSVHMTPSITNSWNMHNYMSLANDKYVVALYQSVDNVNEGVAIVLVVREVQSDQYFGNTLDWVYSDKDVGNSCSD